MSPVTRPGNMAELCMNNRARHGQRRGHGQGAGERILDRPAQKPGVSGRKKKSPGVGQQA